MRASIENWSMSTECRLKHLLRGLFQHYGQLNHPHNALGGLLVHKRNYHYAELHRFPRFGTLHSPLLQPIRQRDHRQIRPNDE